MTAAYSVFRTLLQAMAFAFLTSCGGDGGGGSTPPAKVAPMISNLSYSPTAMYVSTAPMNFTGEFDFADPDGDLASVTLMITDGAGATVNTLTEPIADIAGSTAGTIQGSVLAMVADAGHYTLQIYVTDAAGLRSNVLSGPLRIAPFPWTRKLGGPTAREYAAVAELGGRFYVLGGQRTDAGVVPGPATDIVEIYDPASNTWTSAPAMPTARMGLVAAAVNGKLYAIGGRTDGYSTSAVGLVEVFDPVTQQWTTKSPMPTPRYFAAGAPVNGLIHVAGGESVTSTLNVVEAYNPLTDAWSGVAPLPTARGQLAAVAANGRLYAVGGYAGLLSQWVGTVEMFDPALGTWSTRSPMLTPRAHLALAEVNGKLIAAGGENVERALDQAEGFDPLANAWTGKAASPVAFTRASAGSLNGRMYLFGNGLTLEYVPANDLK